MSGPNCLIIRSLPFAVLLEGRDSGWQQIGLGHWCCQRGALEGVVEGVVTAPSSLLLLASASIANNSVETCGREESACAIQIARATFREGIDKQWCTEAFMTFSKSQQEVRYAPASHH